MTNERMLQICVAAMAALGTLMLGTSQESSTLPIVALMVAPTALLFTDVLGWFRLHPYVAGAAAMVAAFNAFVQAQSGGLETQFLSVANLLIHLQIILLFQRKAERIYWQLITLSLLQVVVAAALNLFVLFGPLLVLYTGFAIGAMLLFFVFRETAPFLEKLKTTVNKDGTIQSDSSLQWRTGTKLTQPRRMLLKVSFVRQFFMLVVSTIVVSAGVFLLMPRFGDGVWRAESNTSKTGFSGEVDLEDVGSIFENPTVVMRVSFFDVVKNQPYSVIGYPYFRGGVLDIYRTGGRWQRDSEFELERDSMRSMSPPNPISSSVRQQVHLESPRGATVFSASPPCGLKDGTTSIRVCPRTLEVRYFPEQDEDPIEYSLGTLGFVNGIQTDFLPADKPISQRIERERRDKVRRKLPDLSAKADDIVANLSSASGLERARELEAHFRNGNEGYKYSLDPSPDRDTNRWPDPVEDFVMNHKTGHCQFFASALALMLRSQGIPARVVVGYRADSYNVVGGYYQLREMDAHAWVEALVSPDEVPEGEILPDQNMKKYGAWVRLDPTPDGNLLGPTVATSRWRQQLNDSIDYMQLLWSEYVLGLNEKRQRKAIYEPIKNAIRNVATFAFGRESWAARWELVRERFQGDLFTRDNLRDSVILVSALIIAAYVLRILGSFLWRWIHSHWRVNSRRASPKVEFYREFETILAKHGLRRSEKQTPLEFATVVGQRLNQLSHGDLSDIPNQIVELFYRVRFGSVRLDTSEVKRLENWLSTIQQALARRKVLK